MLLHWRVARIRDVQYSILASVYYMRAIEKTRLHVLCQCARDSHTSLDPRSQLYQPDTLPFCDDLTFLPSCLMRRSAAAWAWAEKRPG